MNSETIVVAAIVTGGVFLTAVAWQILAIARTAVASDKWAEREEAKR
jgi:hypothetical protein